MRDETMERRVMVELERRVAAYLVLLIRSDLRRPWPSDRFAAQMSREQRETLRQEATGLAMFLQSYYGPDGTGAQEPLPA